MAGPRAGPGQGATTTSPYFAVMGVNLASPVPVLPQGHTLVHVPWLWQVAWLELPSDRTPFLAPCRCHVTICF